MDGGDVTFRPVEFHISCNTPDERVLANIRSNARRSITALKLRRAIVVGGGPSVADHLDLIRKRVEDGWDLFALNAAAGWLYERGVRSTYQVLYDARPLMVDMIDYTAHHHLVASQCDPSVLQALEGCDVTLFHANNTEGTLELLQEVAPGSHVLGGANTVGLQAINILCVMGYRLVELYGYDSSWRDGAKHAYPQSANDDQTPRTFQFEGKEYVSSGAMAQQAQAFWDAYPMWKGLGLEFNIVGEGLLPDMWRSLEGFGKSLEETEPAKYQRIWDVPAYRTVSPGERLLPYILDALQPSRGAKIIDFGCGCGRATQALSCQGYDVLGIDFAPNCLDPDIMVPFCIANLWDLPKDISGDFGVCCDVMEHIPPEKVDAVLANISKAVRSRIYFNISLRPDQCGAFIGQPLHLTVMPHTWWHAKLNEYFPSVTALDDGQFICSQETRHGTA